MVNHRKRVSLEDVAKAAYVSRTTASSALSGTGRVSVETVAAVRQAAAELGYRPSTRARFFRSGDQTLVGLAFQDMPDGESGRDTKAFWERLIYASIHQLNAAGIATVVLPHLDPAFLARLPLDAIAMVVTDEKSLIPAAQFPTGIPLLGVGFIYDRVSEFDGHILAPSGGAIDAAFDHLVERGSTRPAFICTDQPMSPLAEFEREYRTWCANNSREPLFERSAEIVRAATTLMGRGADSIVLLGDDSLPDLEQLLGTIQASGRQIPNDFMVVAIGEAGRAEWLEPTVTMLETNGQEIGRLLAASLECGVSGRDFGSVKSGYVLVPRESTNRNS